jgi:hypothetical protein
MANYYDLFYTGEVYFGANSQQLHVIWDTGSDWTMVESSDCINCNGDTYDYTQSTTFVRSDPVETLAV